MVEEDQDQTQHRASLTLVLREVSSSFMSLLLNHHISNNLLWRNGGFVSLILFLNVFKFKDLQTFWGGDFFSSTKQLFETEGVVRHR